MAVPERLCWGTWLTSDCDCRGWLNSQFIFPLAAHLRRIRLTANCDLAHWPHRGATEASNVRMPGPPNLVLRSCMAQMRLHPCQNDYEAVSLSSEGLAGQAECSHLSRLFTWCSGRRTLHKCACPMSLSHISTGTVPPPLLWGSPVRCSRPWS